MERGDEGFENGGKELGRDAVKGLGRGEGVAPGGACNKYRIDISEMSGYIRTEILVRGVETFNARWKGPFILVRPGRKHGREERRCAPVYPSNSATTSEYGICGGTNRWMR